MKIQELKPGDKFVKENKEYLYGKYYSDMFSICYSIPSDGYSYYLLNQFDVDLVLVDEYNKSNPDHKRNMY